MLEIYEENVQRACRIDWLREGGGVVPQKQEFLCGFLNAVNIVSNYY